MTDSVPALLTGTWWWQGDDGVARPDVWLELRDGELTGSTGVNRLRGAYGGEPAAVSGPVTTTMRAGPEPAMAVERRVLSVLAEGAVLTVDHDRLTVTAGRATDDDAVSTGSGGTAGVLAFARVDPHPDGEWAVTAVHRPERDAVVSDRRARQVSIAGAHLAVTTPSGAASGSVALGGAGRHSMAISIGPLAATDGDGEPDPDDAALVDALGRVRAWSLDGPVLHLLREDGGIAVTLTR